MFTVNLIPDLAIPMATSGVFDMINALMSDVRLLILTAAGVLCLIFIVYHAVTSRMNLTRILISTFTAAVLGYAIYNVAALKDRVGNEIDDTTVPVQQQNQQNQQQPATP